MIRAAVRLAILLVCAGPAAADYARSNLRFTLYHELGHAVIDQAHVPLFAPEESMADGFAILMADRLHSEEETREIVFDVTRLGRIEAARETFDPWSGYMPGPQRLANAICLWFGLNPEARGDAARALGMPAGMARECGESGRALRAAWAPILRSLKPRTGMAGAATLRPAARGKALRILAPDIDRLNAEIALPSPTPIDVESCGEDNAFYYHYDDRIVLCSEMVDALRGEALSRRP